MKFEARPYQIIAAQKIINNKAVALFLDMGMGKTVSTLTAINELMFNYFEVARVLVIAPLRVAKTTWADEIAQWDHLQHLRVSVVCGSAKQRERALHEQAEIYTINVDNVAWLVSHFGRNWPFDMVVIDESSAFKNPSSKRFKAFKRIRPLINRLVELTGTPAPNGLMDLWSQIYLLDQGQRLGKTITQYRLNYFKPGKSNGHIVYEYVPLPNSANTIYDRISDVCMSLKSEDYINLPERIDNFVKIELESPVMSKYKEFERDLVLETEEITATSMAALSGKLLQFSSGAVYNENGEVVTIHNEKIKALKEIIDNNEGKSVMVMYWFKHDHDRIHEAFSEAVDLKSTESLRDWNNGKIKLGLLNPASAGHGLNLQHGGSIIVWFSMIWNLELYQQANKRLHRSGQKNAVVINHLIAKNTIDERVVQALKAKAKGQNSMIEALKALIKEVRDENNLSRVKQ